MLIVKARKSVDGQELSTYASCKPFRSLGVTILGVFRST